MRTALLPVGSTSMIAMLIAVMVINAKPVIFCATDMEKDASALTLNIMCHVLHVIVASTVK